MIEDSATHIHCQSCGTPWEKSNTTVMHYFQSASHPIGSEDNSPASIYASAEQMTYCPTDVQSGGLSDPSRKPVEGITESPFYERDSRMEGANVDRGQADEGDATSVHKPGS